MLRFCLGNWIFYNQKLRVKVPIFCFLIGLLPLKISMRKKGLSDENMPNFSRLKISSIFLIKKRTKRNRLYYYTYYGTSSWIVFVCFLGELKTPKRHFEINWPLGCTLVCSWIICQLINLEWSIEAVRSMTDWRKK